MREKQRDRRLQAATGRVYQRCCCLRGSAACPHSQQSVPPPLPQMSACRSCGCGILKLLAILIGMIMVLAFVPTVRRPILAAVHTHIEPGGLAFAVSTGILTIAPMIGCKGDYIGCFKLESVEDMVSVYGWEGGMALADVSIFNFFNAEAKEKVHTWVVAVSHAEYRAVAHNPTAQRSPDFFIMSNMSTLPKGVIPEGVAPSLLNLNTGSAEHTGRRKVMAEVFSSLGRHPGPFSVIAPPELTSVRCAGKVCHRPLLHLTWLFSSSLPSPTPAAAVASLLPFPGTGTQSRCGTLPDTRNRRQGEASPYSTPWTADPRAIQDILGLNLFRLLYEVDVTGESPPPTPPSRVPATG